MTPGMLEEISYQQMWDNARGWKEKLFVALVTFPVINLIFIPLLLAFVLLLWIGDGLYRLGRWLLPKRKAKPDYQI